MSGFLAVLLAAAVIVAAAYVVPRHRAYFQAMGKTREARRELCDRVDELVIRALDERFDGDVESLRPILVDCMPGIVTLMQHRGLLPVPHAVGHLLARSLERSERLGRGRWEQVWRTLQSLDEHPEMEFARAVAARN